MKNNISYIYNMTKKGSILQFIIILLYSILQFIIILLYSILQLIIILLYNIFIINKVLFN